MCLHIFMRKWRMALPDSPTWPSILFILAYFLLPDKIWLNMPTAFVSGGSRGVGEATAIALAERGFNVAITYREKQARAEAVVGRIQQLGRNAIAFGGDMTVPEERASLVDNVRNWTSELGCLVLNASGGLEVGKPDDYPMLVNRDAQVGLVNDLRPLMSYDSTAVFVTSHWAHLYGQVEQLTPEYEVVAESKHMGEVALRGMQDSLTADGIRLLIATGDLIGGTATAMLLKRYYTEVYDSRCNDEGKLITTQDMGIAIANAVIDPILSAGHTVIIGGSLESLPKLTL
jgi:NADP-dependent 3-hydroxy acid dehydrogenase YdfG